jgi:hypothetical protein
MNNTFFKQYKDHISFSYSYFDRLVFNGYIQGTYKESNIVQLLKNLNFNKLTNGVIRCLTDQLNSHINHYASINNIPVIWWDSIGGTNGDKKQYVFDNYYQNPPIGKNKVLCILTTKEFVKSATTREFDRKEGTGKYNRLYIIEKPVKQYYIYLHDRELGFCCLKISSYLPFPSKFFCNGHYILQQQLEKKGIAYKMHDNSFVKISDEEGFKKLVSSLPEGEWISSRITNWMDVFFRFHKGNRSTCSKLLTHNWFIGQTELCSNIIFKSPRYLDSLFSHLLAEQHVIGYPDKLHTIFDAKRVFKQTSTRLNRVKKQATIKHWHKSNSIKMYNKGGWLLRVETTINSPELPGRKLKKAVWNLQTYGWYSLGCNNRYFEALSSTDPGIFEDVGYLDKPVIKQNGKRIAAPDLRNEFQVELISILLRPKYLTFGFRTKDLLVDFNENPKTAKIRYELSKLIERRLVKKMEKTNYYVVTKQGWVWMWSCLFQKDFFVNPLLSISFKQEMLKITNQKQKSTTRIRQLNTLLNQMYQDFRIVA